MDQIEVMLCMDIGGTNCRIGLCDHAFALHEKEIESTERMTEQGFADALTELIKRFIERNRERYAIRGISLGFPATIDKARRTVLQAPAIEGIENLKVCELLEETFGLPAYLEKDVNLLLQYDMHFLGLPKEGLLIGIYFGTGIGNAILIDGKPYMGRNGVAGELGHIPQIANARQCSCGNTGCLEPLGGGKRLDELCRATFIGQNIRTIYRDRKDTEEIREQIDAMAIAVATEVNILDPDDVVLGGGLLQMEGFPTEELERRIHSYVRKPYPERNLRILYSRPNQENGIIGAGIYGWSQADNH